MPVYSVQGQQAALTTSYKTALLITAAAANASGIQVRGFKVFDINVGAGSAPASTDTNIQFDVSRQTAAGTATAYTANPQNTSDPAFMGLAGVNATGEGTITANSSVFNQAMNQRAPYRWQTYLGSGGEILVPATASNGIALRVLSAGYTGAAGGTVYFLE